MKNITINWVWGNFRVTAATKLEIDEPVNPLVQAVLEKGFLQLLQRVPSSKAEKALAGYEKRPEGFRRDSIPFSEDNALALSEAFGTEVEVEEGVMLKFAITDVSEHEGGEVGASRKMATEMAFGITKQLVDDTTKAQALGMLAFIGVTDEGKNNDGLIEACHKFLAGMRKKKGK